MYYVEEYMSVIISIRDTNEQFFKTFFMAVSILVIRNKDSIKIVIDSKIKFDEQTTVKAFGTFCRVDEPTKNLLFREVIVTFRK